MACNELSVLILTFNEEKHIERCLRSVLNVTSNVYVVDSYSTDDTVRIAESMGAKVYSNPWENYARQFQWGLDNCPINTEWVMRMDADEYILPDLAEEIVNGISEIGDDISGLFVRRRVRFMERWIKHGGYYPIWLLRVWRHKSGIIEERWMDEHIKLFYGNTMRLSNDIVDENLNNITWWINKHNGYATREAIDLLNTLFKFTQGDEVKPNFFGTQEQRKRFLKNVYARLPLFFRPFIYFAWRYVFLLGFLDGRQGLVWHFLQGFWYRFLVDVKIMEAYKAAGKDRVKIMAFLSAQYGVRL